MQAVAERRIEGNMRIPLDAPIELTCDNLSQPIEAFGLNLGVGGLSMRTPWLPAPGSRFQCRFRSPNEPYPIMATAEVVWVQSHGANQCDVGLKFVEIEVASELAVQRMVTETLEQATNPGINTEEDADSHEAKIYFAGTRSPFEGRIVEQSPTELLIEHELPFLKLGTSASLEKGEGWSGCVYAVEVIYKNKIPHLSLTLRSEDSDLDDIQANAFDTDSTVPEFVPVEVAPPISEASIRVEASPEVLPLELASPPKLELAEEDSEPIEIPSSWKRNEIVQRITNTLRDAKTNLVPRLQSVSETARSKFAQVESSALRRARQACIQVAGRILALLIAARTQLQARFAQRTRRRATAPAPVRPRTTHASERAKAKTSPITDKPNYPLLMGTAVVASGFTAWIVYHFSSSSEASAAQTREDRSSRVTAAPVAPVPEPTATAAAAQPQPAPPPAQPSTYVSPMYPAPQAQKPEPMQPAPVPTALPAPSYQAGPIPAPSFPTIQRPAETTAPSANLSAEPSAPTPTPAPPTTSFGATSVPHGKTFFLRMSQPVTNIRGIADSRGFTVVIPGALALDRAGPISAAHGSVERAMVLNQGDHAILHIRFVPGRMPIYRVAAKNNGIEVTLGS